ncbi:rRNA biogenesis protein rrp5 [Tulasnella sp. 332]|nr:rRNA biogenesis protein rrp5 [Tulasnella sp. 332]
MAVKRRQNEADTATHPVKKAKKTHFDDDGKAKEENPRTITKKPTKVKKARRQDEETEDSLTVVYTSASINHGDDIDFPRGGGGRVNVDADEAEDKALGGNDDLFKDTSQPKPHISRVAKERPARTGTKSKVPQAGDDEPSLPIHSLTYKNIIPDVKILCCVISVKPLALVVSLPGQLVGHIPVTHVSSTYTARLASADEEENSPLPELADMFAPGDWLRAVVTRVQAPGIKTHVDLGAVSLTDDERGCARVELTIAPEQVNDGITKADLVPGFTLPAVIRSVEDHGYIVGFGIAGISGFLSFGEAQNGSSGATNFPIGMVIQCSVLKLSENGRTCNVTVDPEVMTTASASEASSISSLLPGTLVSALITDITGVGINVQVLGLFQGTINFFHLPRGEGTLSDEALGRRIKARVLYDIRTSTPSRFALSLLPHVLQLTAKFVEGGTTESDEMMEGDAAVMKEDSRSVTEAFPKGTRLDAVKVICVHSGWGITCSVTKDVLGFVSIHDVSKEEESHPQSWAVGTVHAARVLGFAPIDGVLKMTVKSQLLEEAHLTAGDLTVGQVVRVTIKRLTPTHMIVALSDMLSGIVFPSHYSDVLLKHPEKKFVVSSVHKARVHYIDLGSNKVRLTMKKSLIQSELPILSRLDDAKAGTVLHGTIYKFLETAVLVEYFGDIKAYVGVKELSDEPVYSISAMFSLGQVVKTRITSVNRADQKIWASIRQALPSYEPEADLGSLLIGDVVKGNISAVHKNNIRVTLEPSKVTALVSLFRLARHRKQDAVQTRLAITTGEAIEGLVVTKKNEEDRTVICAFTNERVIMSAKPKGSVTAPGESSADSPTRSQTERTYVISESCQDFFTGIDDKEENTMERASRSAGKTSFKIGDIVQAKVVRKTNKRIELIVGTMKAYLSPTDISDDYDNLPAFVAETTVKAIVIGVMKRYIQISTRRSHVKPNFDGVVIDKEINGIDELAADYKCRGFVTSLAGDHCLIALGRKVTANLPLGPGNGSKPDLKFDVDRGSRRNFEIGDQVDALVCRKSPRGLLLRISHTSIKGMCRREEITGNPEVDIDQALEAFEMNDLVRAVILRNDSANNRVLFSLRRSRFNKGETSMPTMNAIHQDSSDSEDDLDFQNGNAIVEGSGSDTSGRADSDEEAAVDFNPPTLQPSFGAIGCAPSSGAPILKIQGGFQWAGPSLNDDAASEAESSGSEDVPSSSNKKNVAKTRIQQDLTAQMHNKIPESSTDFERMLRATPDSSFVWIQFMAFQLQLSEIEKAREIGRRALQVINFREEQEKLNVWIALLNLEVAYGTEETLQDVFSEAIRANDAKTVHLRTASLLDEAGKHEQAEAMYDRTTKKFATSSKVWTLFGEHCLQHSKPDEGRRLLPRSLKGLEKRKHLKTITRFALLEYQLGDPERGKTIFEGIIDSHPKRFDLWIVYMDQEAKLGNIDALRNLYGRLFSQKLSAKKAKFFFKKWLETERSIGSDAGADKVKAKAVEWMEQNSPPEI